MKVKIFELAEFLVPGIKSENRHHLKSELDVQLMKVLKRNNHHRK